MGHIKHQRVLVALSLIVALTVVSPAAVMGQSTESSGLRVDNTIISLSVAPGQTYTHDMVVSLGSGAPGMTIRVSAMGFGQTPSGSFTALAPENDLSPYSARGAISSIEPSSFELKPGGAQPVRVTINVPQDIGTDPRYAVVYVQSDPVGPSDTAIQISAIVPVILTPADAATSEVGEISELRLGEVQSGEPINITTVFQNTGNHHYAAGNRVTVRSAAGQVVLEADIPASKPSLIPTFSHEFDVSRSLLDLPDGLPQGEYQVESVVLHENGSVLATKTGTLKVTAPYDPLPGIDRANLVVRSFTNEEPGTIDARQAADVVVSFRDTGPVTGTVAIGKYSETPAGLPVALDAKEGEGGTGRKPLKYIGIRVDGFSAGVANATVYYQGGEIATVSESSLVLAYTDESGWQKLDDLTMFSGADGIAGDIAVSKLTGGPVLALGGSSGGGAMPYMQYLPIALGVVGGAVVAGGVVLIVGRVRRH